MNISKVKNLSQISDIHDDPVLFVNYMVLSGNAILDPSNLFVEKSNIYK